MLIASSLILFAIVAVASGNLRQLTLAGLTGLLDRMVALALVAIGQSFVIIAGSIDLVGRKSRLRCRGRNLFRHARPAGDDRAGLRGRLGDCRRHRRH